MITRLLERVQRLDLADSLGREEGSFHVVAMMTALLLILQVAGSARLDELIAVGGAAGILLPRLLHRPAYWLGMTAMLVANHVQRWASLDNHQYLITYWCLAMGTSQLVAPSNRVLATNARLLIGLCFLFATAWKLLSDDFIDGTFFHFTMLVDRRFMGLADLAAGVSPEITAANQAALRDLVRPTGLAESIRLQDAPRVGDIAQMLAVWTVAIEGSLAVLFLLPLRERLAPLRDWVLLLFMLTTYSVATVVGFGRVLSVMGLAQTSNRLGVERIVYVALFLFLPLFRLPFSRFLQYIFG